jgi:hypothetical protein
VTNALTKDYLYRHHLRELARGGVQNPDGSISTVRGMTAPDESGRHRMVPTVRDGQVLEPRDAYRRAQQEGLWRYPGSFSPTRAYYDYMTDPDQHPRMEQDVEDYKREK